MTAYCRRMGASLENTLELKEIHDCINQATVPKQADHSFIIFSSPFLLFSILMSKALFFHTNGEHVSYFYNFVKIFLKNIYSNKKSPRQARGFLFQMN